jgi:hypothetical protein
MSSLHELLDGHLGNVQIELTVPLHDFRQDIAHQPGNGFFVSRLLQLIEKELESTS